MRLAKMCLPFLTCTALCYLDKEVHGQSSATIQTYLSEANKNCSLYAYQENFRGRIPGADHPITIASYTVESCGGSNQAERTVGVFYEADGRVKQYKPPDPPIPGPDVDDRNGVTVRGTQITVRYSDYGPDDPRCCPSLKRTANYRLTNGGIVPVR